ncbi:MAG: LamG domain-containing protein [Bacteroidota bacterium]
MKLKYGTYDNGTMNLYKNGVFQSTAICPYTDAVATNLPLIIGRDITTEYFSGNLDDIGIWSRALTTAEIQLLSDACQLCR